MGSFTCFCLAAIDSLILAVWRGGADQAAARHNRPGVMAPTPSSPLPPAAAEYETAVHAGPGKLPQVQKWKMFRSSQGETHLDFGKTGLISKSGAMQSILLDHAKREARIVPAPAHAQAPLPASPQVPGGAPHLPAPPSALLHVKDLGKQTIGGHEAEGKLYTFQPPKIPGLPKPPGAWRGSRAGSDTGGLDPHAFEGAVAHQSQRYPRAAEQCMQGRQGRRAVRIAVSDSARI